MGLPAFPGKSLTNSALLTLLLLFLSTCIKQRDISTLLLNQMVQNNTVHILGFLSRAPCPRSICNFGASVSFKVKDLNFFDTVSAFVEVFDLWVAIQPELGECEVTQNSS